MFKGVMSNDKKYKLSNDQLQQVGRQYYSTKLANTSCELPAGFTYEKAFRKLLPLSHVTRETFPCRPNSAMILLSSNAMDMYVWDPHIPRQARMPPTLFMDDLLSQWTVTPR